MDGTESELEAQLVRTLHLMKVPHFETQHMFHPTRKWRFDVAWPELKIAIEVQGFGPQHNSKKGMENDCEKHNAAILLGWRILYYMNKHINPPHLKFMRTEIGSLFNGNVEEESNKTDSETGRIRRQLYSRSDKK